MTSELRRYILCAKLYTSASSDAAKAHYFALAETYHWFLR